MAQLFILKTHSVPPAPPGVETTSYGIERILHGERTVSGECVKVSGSIDSLRAWLNDRSVWQTATPTIGQWIFAPI